VALVQRFSLVALRRHLSVGLPVFGGATLRGPRPRSGSGGQMADDQGGKGVTPKVSGWPGV